METLRKNEIIDLLEINDILYVLGEYNSILLQHPQYGECTYWCKKDRLHIHKCNEWKNNGFYIIKNTFK